MVAGYPQSLRTAQVSSPMRPLQPLKPGQSKQQMWPLKSMQSVKPWQLRMPAGALVQAGQSEMSVTAEASTKPAPSEVEVAVAGGGLGGLAACAALRARGINAHVFEAAPQLLRGSTGTGIMISANGFQALQIINDTLPMLMRERGARITRQTINMTDPTGIVKNSFNMNATNFKDKYGAEQYNVGWAQAHAALASIVPAEAVHTGYKLESYAFDKDDEALDISFDNGQHVRASLLVGADGVGSVVRRLVAGDAACETQYSGQLLWNALLDSKDVPHAHGTGEVEFVVTGNDGQAILVFDAGEGKTSWYLTLMEKDAPPGVKAALASGAFGGFGRSGVISELEKIFAPWPVAVDLLRATPETQIFERRLADRAALEEWADTSTNGGGRVVLIGDAAHPMIPSQGQGTMMTWEDAADLAALLALKSKEHGLSKSVPAAVSDFVGRRAERCAMVQKHSAESYMGKPVPPLPILTWRMLVSRVKGLFGFKSVVDQMYGGYTAVRSSDAGAA
eukprot:gnl/MRDRNA2_/MRDRNA2_94813_c0_seq1.p1 gnl/MRDRNA2_/MRDRNA2_94813_c0~~gnl/MRDRNA2_/MRDRNA2_94813_c0_seq1.p1  ORF type:complete len:592 (+),score=134.09 gnl/MRDRNA2_/MRDRNA2_94813_c0_seq1:255-1778(+)